MSRFDAFVGRATHLSRQDMAAAGKGGVQVPMPAACRDNHIGYLMFGLVVRQFCPQLQAPFSTQIFGGLGELSGAPCWRLFQVKGGAQGIAKRRGACDGER